MKAPPPSPREAQPQHPSALGEAFACPAPIGRYDTVVLGHGSGGRLSQALIRDVFLAELPDESLHALEDQAVLPAEPGRLALTTDAFVVHPLCFPGGDIGSLAVHGTVNDLAMGGAEPRYLAAAFILEEGLSFELLRQIASSMRLACERARVRLVTGDTKVVDRGKGDGVFITTTGVGFVPAGRALSVRAARPGDAVIVSGTIGDHGVAVMAVREGIELETELRSDSAPLNGLVAHMFEHPGSAQLHCMRDPTRGGVASALNEIASASGVAMRLYEDALPLRPEVHAVCQLLGLDPLYVANEGKLLAIVAREAADALVDCMRVHPLGRDARVIGEVTEGPAGRVVLRSRIGGERVVAMLAGEQLPRIC